MQGGQRTVTCVLATLADVLACAHEATELASALGFPQRATWELGIAVSELATNVTRHGGGGSISIGYVDDPAPGILVIATDKGPGIPDVEAAMGDDFSEGRVLSRNVPPNLREGLGSGLGAVLRLTDDVRIETSPGAGTTVRAFKRLPAVDSGALGSALEGHAAEQPAEQALPTLILGLGNAILCDDGVGIKAARYIESLGPNPDVVVKAAELAGFALIDLMEGFDRAIVIDAVRVRDGKPGDVVVFESGAIAPSLHLVAGHQIDLPTALEMGRRLGRHVPTEAYIVGVQIEDDTTFSESCTPAVTAAIPTAANMALRLVAASR